LPKFSLLSDLDPFSTAVPVGEEQFGTDLRMFLPVLHGFLPVLHGFLPVLHGFLPVLHGFLPVLHGFLPVLHGFFPVLHGFSLSCTGFPCPARVFAVLHGFLLSCMGFYPSYVGFCPTIFRQQLHPVCSLPISSLQAFECLGFHYTKKPRFKTKFGYKELSRQLVFRQPLKVLRALFFFTL
jgi:hypothetical protein